MIQDQTIRRLAAQGKYLLSKHADKERREDKITIEEIEQALRNCEVIEHYPNDPRGESCLVLGYRENKPIHAVCAHKTETDDILVITVYDPTLKPEKWTDNYRKRK